MNTKDISNLLIIALAGLLMFYLGDVRAEINDQVMDIPTKCIKKLEQTKVLEQQLADRIFILWVKEGNKEEPRQLYNRAYFTASWILIDNGIVCRHPKYK